MTLKAGRGTILLLAAIASLGSLATQLLVPALPAISRDLASGPSDTQLVVSLFLIGLGLGQLLTGPLSDRYGRRPVLLAGLAIYCCGSALAAVAASLPVLLAARLVQAVGGAAGIVGARVLVRDLFPPEEASARQATLMAVVLISPAVAPVVGGLLTDWTGWRMLFAMLAAGGVACSLLVLATLPRHPVELEQHSRWTLRRSLVQLVRNRRFLALCVTVAAGSSALYIYLSSAPFLLSRDFGLSARDVGLCLMAVATTSIGGTFLVAPLDRRGRALMTGSALTAAGGIALMLAALSGVTSLVGFLCPTMILGLGAGISGPAGFARITGAQPGIAGTATSIAGAFQMLVSALSSWLFSHFAPLDEVKLGIGLTIAGLVAASAAIVSHRAGARARACITRTWTY
ncbi:Bcr/CflA family efflux MFS transporter [Alteraurantiacibacter buctensis]|uniref:Bcr/CflA family efflux transporter n=1 Tax=Alteraurantiacibacter buctensis TaxID=1503981 RepID=A0A844YY84_9SPHN|nr:Bcr/CflA family efflux MFS transporter [Alteraurantiacibacter buctensis]MXO71986.1 Bcr/CflA family efflux MFS transporter [Alteraurantiacibacter buctensis]